MKRAVDGTDRLLVFCEVGVVEGLRPAPVCVEGGEVVSIFAVDSAAELLSAKEF